MIDGLAPVERRQLDARRRRADALLRPGLVSGDDPLRRLRLPAGRVPGAADEDPLGLRAGRRSTSARPARSACSNPGETPNDPYKATPDELLARGKALFESGRLREAAGPLEELFGGYTPRDEVARDAARMLLTIHIKDYQPRKVVQDFEILKEKAPDLTIPFDEVLVVGRAYRDIGEHERAYLVWRAIVEASYLEDAQVGEVLRRRGKTLDAVAYLLDLWRDYPNTASIEADLFGLSQLLAVSAGKAIADPALRKELADAGVTRSELILQAIRLDQVLLSPVAQEPAGRRDQPGPRRRLPRAGGLRGRRPPRRRGSRGSTPGATSSTASSIPRPWASSTSATTTAPSRSPRRSPRRPTRTPTASTSRARTSGRRPTSSARSTTPAASRRRPSNTTSSSPTGSPTPPAP